MPDYYKKLLAAALFFSFFYSQASAQQEAKILHQLNDLLINTVMHDVYTPPVASRIYTYPNIAFYECLNGDKTEYPGLAGKLNGLKQIPAAPGAYNDTLAAYTAFAFVAQKLVGSEEKFIDWFEQFHDSVLQTKVPLVEESVDYGRKVANHILDWAKEDNYGPTRAMPRFTNSDLPGKWQLTPADYATAIEPHWKEMRPFTLHHPGQFMPKKILVYSRKKGSPFYKTMMELYKLTSTLDTAQKATAKYWDDNPNVSVNLGHLNYFIHKISPGGHWLMIAKQACIDNNVGIKKSALAYTLTAIALYDAFISSWDVKFKTNLIRPITVINQFVDQKWEPYIQTPPFPEFTSGHAVISNAAATILTHLFGDKYKFTDYTEIPFGNTSRSFNSFYEAAHEVSWSRVYGGIHYPLTAEISIEQGKDIGNFVYSTLKGNKK